MSSPLPVSIGVDFGGTTVKLAAVRGADLLGPIERIPTREFASPETLIEAIGIRVEQLKKNHPGIVAIGIGVPGAVDFDRGVTYNLTNVPGWSNVPLRDKIAARTGLPTVLENDANCAAYAEFRCGTARGLRNIVVVTLGTGVGGGLILNGDLYRGSQFAAGEIGQISVDYRGVDGPYGNFGALERYIGNQQITELAARRFREAGGERPESDCSPESLAQAAATGDEIATGVWKEVATLLGTALASVVYLLNPDAIVIGGGVAHAGDVLFAPLRERMRSILSFEFYESLKILPAELGNTAGIVGGAALALNAHFR